MNEYYINQRAKCTEVWERNKKYLEANNGWGMCNTGSGVKTICALGGIGCNVDHVRIKRSKDKPL